MPHTKTKKCTHTLEQHLRMDEAIAGASLAGYETKKTICELIDLIDK